MRAIRAWVPGTGALGTIVVFGAPHKPACGRVARVLPRMRRDYRFRALADFLDGFFAADFLPPAPLAVALAEPFLPNAAAQLSEYFFDAPIRTIVTALPFSPATKMSHAQAPRLI
jgi:hypothetical protein